MDRCLKWLANVTNKELKLFFATQRYKYKLNQTDLSLKMSLFYITNRFNNIQFKISSKEHIWHMTGGASEEVGSLSSSGEGMSDKKG